jgi:hypothetical protein
MSSGIRLAHVSCRRLYSQPHITLIGALQGYYSFFHSLWQVDNSSSSPDHTRFAFPANQFPSHNNIATEASNHTPVTSKVSLHWPQS